MTTKYTYVKYNGIWRVPKNVFIRQSATWNPVKGIWYKQNGEWLQVWPSQTAVLSVDQDTYNLSTTLNQTSSRQQITITNSGDYDLRITSITSTNSAFFNVALIFDSFGKTPSEVDPMVIAPGASAFFEATITGLLLPVDNSGATITINTLKNVLDELLTKTVAIRGTVTVLAGDTKLNKSSLSLSTLWGSTSTAEEVTVTNNGQDTITVTSITATTPSEFTINVNTSKFGTLPVSIPVNSTKTFSVTILGGSAGGTGTGTVTLAYTKDLLNTAVTKEIPLTGSVVNSAGKPVISPETKSFGTLYVNEQSSPTTFKVENKGDYPIVLNSIVASTPSKFTISVAQKTVSGGGIGPTLPVTIEVNQSKTFDVRLDAGSSTGTDSGTVTLNFTVDPLGQTVSTAITVDATVAQLVPGFLEITPSPLTGTVKNGQQNIIGTIKILNKGQTSITGLAFTSTAPAQWSYGAFSGPAGQGAISEPLGGGVAYELKIPINGLQVGSGSGSINFTGTATGGGAITGSVTVTGTVEASATTEVPVPKLPVIWFNDDPDKDGEPEVEFTSNNEQTIKIILKNTGTAPATVIKINDDEGGTGSPSAEWFLKADNLPATIAAGSTASFNITKKAFTPLTSLGRTLRFTFQEQTTNLNDKYTHPSILKGISIVLQEGPPPSGTVDLVAPAGFVSDGGAYVASWTVPAGVSKVRAILLGGGGGGAGGLEGDPWINGGGGGGAGEYLATTVDVTPGKIISYKIGAGGRGSAASSGGNAPNPFASRGGNTEFNGLIAQGGYPPTTGTYGGNRRPVGGVGGSTGAGAGQVGQDAAVTKSGSSTLDAVVMRGGAGGSVNISVTGGAITGTGGAAGAGGEIDWYLNGAASSSYGIFAGLYGIWYGLTLNASLSKTITFTTTITGTYTIDYVMDDSGSLSIQEQGVAGDKINFSSAGPWKTSARKTVKLVGGKTHTLTFDVKNSNGQGLIGILISDPDTVEIWSTRDLANGRNTPQGPNYVKGVRNGGNATGFGAGGGGGNGRSGDAPPHGAGGNGAPGMIRLIWPPS